MNIRGPHKKNQSPPRTVVACDVIRLPKSVELMITDDRGQVVEVRMSKAGARKLAENLYGECVQA